MAIEDFLNRDIAFVAPKDVGPFLVTRFAGSEPLGRLFEYDLELVSLDRQIDFPAIMAQPVALIVAEDQNGPERIVHGYVSRFTQTEPRGRYMQYLATVVPFIWFLNRTAECRMLPQGTVPQIVRQLLSDRGYDDVDDKRLIGTYTTRDYCVQYRETDFNFISRLLEDEGIGYFFEHRRDGDDDFKHVMVLCDSFAKLAAGPGCAVLHAAVHLGDGTGCVTDWTVMSHVHSHKASLIDFDFKSRNRLRASNAAEVEVQSPFGEMVDHPGGFTVGDDGDRLSAIRAQEYATRRTIYRGVTAAHGLRAG